MKMRMILAFHGFMAIAAATPAAATSSREMLDLLAKCAEITEATARLACYDQLAPQLRETVATIKKPAERTEAEKESLFGFDFGGIFSSPEGPTTPEEFGKNQMPQTQEEEAQVLESVTAGVTDYGMTPFGKFIVFLDNGQVWRQLDSDTGVASFMRAAKDNEVTVSRGLFGSYNLKINDGNGTYKVKRIK
jgi:hypothetical protein